VDSKSDRSTRVAADNHITFLRPAVGFAMLAATIAVGIDRDGVPWPKIEEIAPRQLVL
jgi:hypothetical protein